MAITVDPSFTPPAPAQKVTSPDGLLTAQVDATNAGVLLWADFGGSPEQVVATNLFPDPAMTKGAAAWPTTGGTVANGSEGGVKTTAAGTGYVIASDTAAGDQVHGLAGATKLYVSADVRTTGTTGVGVQVAQADANGTGLGNASNYVAAPVAGAWARVAFVLTLAVGADHTTQVQLIRSSGATAGDTTEWRNLRFSTLSDGPYFDGSTPADGTYSYRWSGTPGASTSQKYIPGVGGLNPLPDLVEFHRGDGTLVRSGDPSSAPGGVAWAYDHEAPIGSAASYYAVPLSFAGVAGAQTDTVTVATPNVDTVRNLWMKSPVNPNLSARVWVEDPPQVTNPARATVTVLRGASVGASTWDVRSGKSTQVVIVTETAAEAATVEALLDCGPLLLQTRPDYDFPDLFWLPGDWQRERVARMDNPMSRWTVPLTQCRRPATLDAPLRIPGNTCGALPDLYPTCADLLSRVATCADLVGVSL